MKDWNKFEFGSIVEISSNKFYPKKDNRNYPCIELSHIEQGTGRINGWVESREQKSTKNGFRKGEVLYGKLRPYLKKYYLANFDGVCSTEIWVLNGKKDYILNEYLFYLIQTERFNKVANVTTGTKMPRADWEYISQSVFKIPDIDEQQKIAQILSAWDEAIDLKEKLIEEKQEQKKGLMQNLLTGKIRLAGFEEEWEEVSLGELVKKIKGRTVSYDAKGKHPVIDMEYLDSGVFKNYSDDDSVIASTDDVLLLWDGAKAGKSFTLTKGIVGSTFVKLECKQVNNIYLHNHFVLNENLIMSIREGSGIPHVPKDFLQYYTINLPSLDEQKAIANILSTADREIDLLKEEVELLKEQKKGLMQLLLTGIVRVDDLKI